MEKKYLSVKEVCQETGLNILSMHDGYVLTSCEPTHAPRMRDAIDDKLRYAVLQRDNSTCQRCGANPVNTPDVKLNVDNNLWTLCSRCNGGKKSFFDDSESDLLKTISSLSNASKRLQAYFEAHPNIVIEPIKLSTIANTRDWERALRKLRADTNMDIKAIRPSKIYPYGGYIYKK